MVITYIAKALNITASWKDCRIYGDRIGTHWQARDCLISSLDCSQTSFSDLITRVT